MEQNEALNLTMEEENKFNNQKNTEPVKPMANPTVVYGHRRCQTRDVAWLSVQDVYYKFQRPNMYNIGGTYIEDVAHYWFTFKTEQLAEPNLKLSLTTYSFSDLDVKFLKDRNLYIAVSFPLSNTNAIGDIKISHDFEASLHEPIGSDFVIESANGFKFHVHKALLAAYSEVFKAMLKDETAESQNGYVKLSDISEEDLRCMIQFIYTGKIKDVDSANFVNLFILGYRYNLKGLVELSEHVLSQQLSIDNAVDILIVADMYDSDVLKQSAFKFIKKNMAHLTNTLKEINNADLYRQLCLYFM